MQLRDDAELHTRILSTIHLAENADYNSYLSSPLLLSMFILTYNSYPELPKSKSKFYWNVFDTLCTKHDSYTKKGGFLHERKSGLQNEELENILKWLSYISIFEGNYSFDELYLTDKLKLIRDKLELKFDLQDVIYDLVVSISILIADGQEYKFPHKSLQEYLTALLVREQSDEAKTKIYHERFATIERRVAGSNQNLWSICIELDKHAIYTKFFIPHLTTFLKEMKAPPKHTVASRFYNTFKNGEGFTMKGKKLHYDSYSIPGGPLIPIVSYFNPKWTPFVFVVSQGISNKDGFDEIAIKYSKPDGPKEAPNSSFWLSYKDIPIKEFGGILNGTVVENTIKEFIADTEATLSKLHAEIQNESAAKNDLLDL